VTWWTDWVAHGGFHPSSWGFHLTIRALHRTGSVGNHPVARHTEQQQVDAQPLVAAWAQQSPGGWMLGGAVGWSLHCLDQCGAWGWLGSGLGMHCGGDRDDAASAGVSLDGVRLLL
jgi:hypothetical protein